MTSITDASVAVVHGTALERGGGVQVAEELARVFDAPLFFGLCTKAVEDRISADIEHHRLFQGMVSRFVREKPFLRNLYQMGKFQHVPQLHDFDVIIQSDNGTSWYVPPEEQVLIRYVHSPPGPLYHRFPEVGYSKVTQLSAFISRILRQPYTQFPDVQVANSETTKRRMEKYFNISTEVVYPPVNTGNYTPSEREDFYFTLSRLTEAKSVDDIVKTFTNHHPEKQLIVGGSGPQEEYLRSISGPNVEIRGWLSEEEKSGLMGSCAAMILNSGNESFGIVPIEAFASGAPVIALDQGHTRYQIRDGWNGILYSNGRLSDAIDRFEEDGVAATPSEIELFAERFSVDKFHDDFRDILRRVLESNDSCSSWKEDDELV